MSVRRWFVSGLIVFLAALPASFGQAASQAPQQEVQEIMAVTYPEGKTVSVKLVGTSRLARAKGEAKVERKRGATEIEIELDEMRPAVLFGGDFATYVFWTISPEGLANNVGEFVLEGNRSKLNVTSRLQTFGMFVTAEPHYLVRSPSRFVVMVNTELKSDLRTPAQTSKIGFRGYEGEYKFVRESIPRELEARSEMRTELLQARKAVELAERAQAEKYALVKLTEARVSLRKTEESEKGRVDKRQVAILGKEAVRLAFEAQTEAEEARIAEKQRADEAERARLAGEAADAQRRAAQEAAQRQEAARLAAEEAARREEENRKAQAAARLREEEAARKAAEEAARRREAEAAAARAAEEASRASREREEARNRMAQALGQIAETRTTARGLIVNLPDILFDTGKSTLRPEAREVISRIAGVLMVAQGINLKVEGHTDSVGGDEYNQRLSEQRASSVKEYLEKAGVKPDLITTEGFGKTQPISDNNTAAGRQKNRRVEIVIGDQSTKP
jgi:outer membrane protein OmpA-like peptidoglycan-associated protein